ncbi:hypothetical protein [Mesorhizobium sp.]|uniref:hypothetical protein n=1 Tax=Mesorhizobium sp. TaxID=1871066 RepID=UPI00120943A9|nr:hypothetical protein [Mesorhizobium sp.]TIW97181.1 MAG: hypothetical protein E5V45_17190 [Mesorhizobium sp.]
MQEVGRYRCLGTSGQEYLVIEFQHMVTFDGLNGRQSRPGTKELRLADGSSSVTFIDENTFQIVSTAEIIRKI